MVVKFFEEPVDLVFEMRCVVMGVLILFGSASELILRDSVFPGVLLFVLFRHLAECFGHLECLLVDTDLMLRNCNPAYIDSVPN